MRRIATILGLLIALNGCAPNVAFDPNEAAAIHSISVTGCDHPLDYYVLSVSISKHYGYVQKLNSELRQKGFNLGGELQHAIADALHGRGYEIRSSGADASLQCTQLLALYDGGMFGTSFTPEVQLDVALTDGVAGKTIFAKRFFYSSSESPMGVTTLEGDPQYDFSSDDAVAADPDRAANGLRASVHPLANAVADMLRKSG